MDQAETPAPAPEPVQATEATGTCTAVTCCECRMQTCQRVGGCAEFNC